MCPGRLGAPPSAATSISAAACAPPAAPAGVPCPSSRASELPVTALPGVLAGRGGRAAVLAPRVAAERPPVLLGASRAEPGVRPTLPLGTATGVAAALPLAAALPRRPPATALPAALPRPPFLPCTAPGTRQHVCICGLHKGANQEGGLAIDLHRVLPTTKHNWPAALEPPKHTLGRLSSDSLFSLSTPWHHQTSSSNQLQYAVTRALGWLSSDSSSSLSSSSLASLPASDSSSLSSSAAENEGGT